jgi:hypothetical protein
VAVPLLAAGPPAPAWLPSVAAFGAVCWLNCRLIDRWESVAPAASWADGLLGGAILAVSAGLPNAVGAAVAGAVLGAG